MSLSDYFSALIVILKTLNALFIESYFAPRSKFAVDDIPDLTGKVIIVTGGNAGIGKETSKALLAKNAKVYIATRTEARANLAIEELKKATGKVAIWLKLDLSSLKSIKASAEEFLKKEPKLDILFNNAGVFGVPVEDATVDGYDMTWGTNALGPFYFTKLLLPALIRASTPKTKSRVVNTSSAGSISALSFFGSGLDFATFKDTPYRYKWGNKLYGQSKLGNVVFTQEFARRYSDKIVTTAVHPGIIKTELGRNLFDLENPFIKIMGLLFLYPTPQGALTQLWAGTSHETANLNGGYLIPWARIGVPRNDDPELGRELWTWFEEQVANV